jgi:hypothetical protein
MSLPLFLPGDEQPRRPPTPHPVFRQRFHSHQPSRLTGVYLLPSPTRPQPCCISDMEEHGTSHATDRWVFQYKRCRQCGFTVRVILREIPDEALVGTLRQILAASFQRNAPEC